MQLRPGVFCAAFALFLALLTSAGAQPSRAADKDAKPISLKLGYFNGPASTCSSATPCQQTKPEMEKDYYTYLQDGYEQVKARLGADKSSDDFQKALLDYYDGLAARDKILGMCYGRCTNYDQPDMLLHATTDTARSQKLDALIDTRYVFYGADKLMKQGMDVTAQIKDGLKRYRR